MIDPKLLRNNIEAVNAALAKRGVQLDVQEWASLETRRKDLQSKTEKLQAERNAGAKQVGQIKNPVVMLLKSWRVCKRLVMKSKLLKLLCQSFKTRLNKKRLAFLTYQMSLFLLVKMKMITLKFQNGVHLVSLILKSKIILT